MSQSLSYYFYDYGCCQAHLYSESKTLLLLEASQVLWLILTGSFFPVNLSVYTNALPSRSIVYEATKLDLV